MAKYDKMKILYSEQFRLLTGVKRTTFDSMLYLLQNTGY